MNKAIDTKELIKLYKKGYFPMAENCFTDDVNFYLPEKRFIIPIEKFHIPKKLNQELKKNKFKFKINSNFEFVLNNCAKPRYKNADTWINNVIKNTYIKLFNEGYAKSIECYYENKIVGGLYGVQIGKAFFGESMFSIITNTSKLCLVHLINILKEYNFTLLDSQYFNKHLLQFGAIEISNKEYQLRLKKSSNSNTQFPKTFNFTI